MAKRTEPLLLGSYQPECLPSTRRSVDVHKTFHSEVRQHLLVKMPLLLMAGRRGQERLLRRACRGDVEIRKCGPKESGKRKKEKVIFTPSKPQLWRATEFDDIRCC